MSTERDHLLSTYSSGGGNKNSLATAMAVLFIISLVALVVTFAILYALAIRKNADNSTLCQLPVNKSTSQNVYQRSVIASDAIPCSSVANNIMYVKGGNAVDGAIAGLLCSCAVNFHSCGIGGGSFVLIYNKTEKRSYAIDIRESAPLAATEDMFVNDSLASISGGRSIAVMGLISGYYEIHQRFGRLPWASLIEPTIEILNNGFYISRSLEIAINKFFAKKAASKYGELRKILTDPSTGKRKRFGDRIKNLKLANTMRILSNEPYAMKNGSLVDNVVAEINDYGGIITKEDLINYTSRWRTPIVVLLDKEKKLYTLPPPSSGALIGFGLNVLSNYGYDRNSLNNCENTGLFYHRFIETMKFAYSKQSALGDSDFVDNTEVINNLTSISYAKWIKSLITDDRTHDVPYYHPSFEMKEDHGTSHFSLISPDGDAVSVTSTINDLFGSLVMGNETGIIYNNEMRDFSTPNKTNIYDLSPSPNNFIEPRKRPMSSMSPIIIVDKSGNVTMVMGASGGNKIVSATSLVSVLAHLLDKDIKVAIDAARAHLQLDKNEVLLEMNFDDKIIEALVKRGHVVLKSTDITTVAQGIKMSPNPNKWQCNADFRKMGLCDGS